MVGLRCPVDNCYHVYIYREDSHLLWNYPRFPMLSLSAPVCETSDNGLSEIRITSIQWTNDVVNLQDGENLPKIPAPSVSVIQRFHSILLPQMVRHQNEA